MEKSCNFGGHCNHKKNAITHWACAYKNFCDYSAPRDSRMAIGPDGGVIQIDEKCNICKQPLSKCEGHA